jgi:hypothetical protein
LAGSHRRTRHEWYDASCRFCGLSEREAWVLDERGRPVMALVWSSPWGPGVRTLAFPPLRGLQPPDTGIELLPLAATFPGVEVGGMPDCPGSPYEWERPAPTGPA